MAMTTTNFCTPRDLLRYAVTRFNAAKLFFGHGSAEAFDEAAYLILHTLKLPLDKLDPSSTRACCRKKCCRCWP
jgi:ribosomal protein L3 glutamine methyltransferase